MNDELEQCRSLGLPRGLVHETALGRPFDGGVRLGGAAGGETGISVKAPFALTIATEGPVPSYLNDNHTHIPTATSSAAGMSVRNLFSTCTAVWWSPFRTREWA
jgi:hypothetical protein